MVWNTYTPTDRSVNHVIRIVRLVDHINHLVLCCVEDHLPAKHDKEYPSRLYPGWIVSRIEFCSEAATII